jgi:hypothetical protein
MLFRIKTGKGIFREKTENPFPRPYDRRSICNSSVSIFTLRQAHSFPYKGDLYISFFKKASKTSYIFHVFKLKMGFVEQAFLVVEKQIFI